MTTLCEIKEQIINKKLTKKNALILCMEHWNKIAEMVYDFNCNNIIDIKETTLRSLINITINGNCAICEYHFQNEYLCCDDCIIYWGNDGLGCFTSTNSQYRKWKRNPTKENALVMAYLAEQSLNNLQYNV